MGQRSLPPLRTAPGAPGPHRPRGPFARALRILLLLALLALVLAASTLGIGYLYYARDLPEFEGLNAWRPPESSRVYAADGTLLAEFFVERRTIVTREQVSTALVDAVLCAEDGDFYRHEGLDYVGMLRALYNSLRAGHVTGSGSTITQQTVKNVLLTHERTFRRKAQEIILTRRLEGDLSKDQILMLYLNAIYFGHGRYGAEAAAQYYFNKPAAELGVNEAATLAGLIQSPARHSPFRHPNSATHRRNYVLDQMVKRKKITAAEAEAVRQQPLPVHPLTDRPRPVEARWFVQRVRRQVTALLGEERLLTGGLHIRTTLDPQRQSAALQAVQEGVAAIVKRQGYGKPSPHLADEAQRERWRAQRVKALKDQQITPTQVHPALFLEATEAGWRVDLGPLTALLQLSPHTPLAEGHPQVGDVYPVRLRPEAPSEKGERLAELAHAPQGAMIAIHPQTRHVLAQVGGLSFEGAAFDRTTQARRQPGSAFKPFVWGAAFESQNFQASSLLVDAPETWQIAPGQWWQPKNYTGRFKGLISLRAALADSINSIAVKLTHEVGVSKVQAFARKLGWRSALDNNLALALGSSVVSPLELVNSYATIAADGVWAEPVWITALEGPDGESLATPAQLRDPFGQDAPEIAEEAEETGYVLDPSPAGVPIGADDFDEDAPDDRDFDEDAPDEVNERRFAARAQALKAASAKAKPDAPPAAQAARRASPQGIDPALAWLLRDVMRSVVLQGSAKSLKGFKRPLVGKTGTSNNSVDTWFVGLLPEVAVGAWFGFDQPKTLGRRESGGLSAVPAVGHYLKAAEAQGADWPPPPEALVQRRIDPKTGLLAAESQPGVEEWFLSGTAPIREAPPEGEVDVEGFFNDQLRALEAGDAPPDAGPPSELEGAAPWGEPEAAPAELPQRPLPIDLSPIAPRATARPASPDAAAELPPNAGAPAAADRPSLAVPSVPLHPLPADLMPADLRGAEPEAPVEAPVPFDEDRFDEDRFDEDRPED